MAKPEFKFIERYRTLMAAANPETITARQKGHAKLYPEFTKNMERVYDMCALAFQLPRQSDTLADWFEKPIREFDPQFIVSIDKAEASRIASLLLEDLIYRGSPQGALAVLVSSFGGRRKAGDDGRLIVAAKEAVEEAGRKRRIGGNEKKISAHPIRQLKAELDAITAGFAPPPVIAAITAAVTTLSEGQNTFATAANDIMQDVRTDNQRLAEEVDMLWWHIGGWSELLDKRIESLSASTVALATGRELGTLVKVVPGPHGAYGLLRRSLSAASAEKTSVTAALKNLAGDTAKLNRPIPITSSAIFPITGAINYILAKGTADLSSFETAIPGLNDAELTNFELATQIYRETVLIGYGGLGK